MATDSQCRSPRDRRPRIPTRRIGATTHDPCRTALEHRVRLGWTQVQVQVFRTAYARLLDVGPAGALVETDAPLLVDE